MWSLSRASAVLDTFVRRIFSKFLPLLYLCIPLVLIFFFFLSVVTAYRRSLHEVRRSATDGGDREILLPPLSSCTASFPPSFIYFEQGCACDL